eukprot:m.15352 g.15352  ORF g.15352 m.15352 type:complete len:533 (-) comp5366_c0_seq1:187-1785(-)
MESLPTASTAEEKHKLLPKHGLSGFAIRMTLNAFRMFDMKFRGGNVFAYVYVNERRIEKIANAAYMDFLSENGLDFTVFPSCLRMEVEVVSMVLSHMRAPMSGCGTFTTGGTESVFMACKAARDRAYSKGIRAPEMVIPVSAHAAFQKAGHLLAIHIITVPLDPITRKADVKAMRAAVSKNCCMVAGSAVQYPHGVCDDIEGIAKIAEDHDIWMHVDACIGGWVLGYYRKLGIKVPKFDFTDVPGVSSISVDLHKYAYCPKPASVIVYRNQELRQFAFFACSEWPGYTVINTSFTSSKSGGPVAGSWACMHAIGEEGYKKIMKKIYNGTKALADGIKKIPDLSLVAEPDSNLITFTSEKCNVFQICDLMKKKGWYIQGQLHYEDSPSNVHISVNQSCEKMAPKILEDLAECTEASKTYRLPEELKAVLKTVEHRDTVTREEYDAMLKAVGVGVGQVPDSLVELNTMMDQLNPKLRRYLLVTFANDAFTHDELRAVAEGKIFMAEMAAKMKKRALMGLGAVGLVAGLVYFLRK